MADSIIVYLDNINENELHIFYNKDCTRFEINNNSNIEFFNSTCKYFNRKKPFIEQTKEEFQNSGRLSDELEARFLGIKDDHYQTFLSIIDKRVKKNIKNIDSKSTIYIDKRNAYVELKELLDIYLFFSKYQDLVENEKYSQFVYYFIPNN